MKIKDFILPIIAGVITEVLYYLLPMAHIFFWLCFLFGFGIWFSIFILKLSERYSGMKFTNGILFCIIGLLIYGATIMYVSKNIEALVPFRRLSFLIFYAFLLFVSMAYILRLKVIFLDYIIASLYGFFIAFILSDREYWTMPHLDLLFSLWVIIFGCHAIVISRRSNVTLNTIN